MPRRIEPDVTTLKVGKRLRELRLERNMSMSELADIAEISKGHLSSVEHGLTAITVQTIARLARALAVSAPSLLTFPDEDDRAEIAELLRKLPPYEIVKLRRELAKSAKETAKASKSDAKKR
jgi:transcriptional regulator with XRE-family HTH domain